MSSPQRASREFETPFAATWVAEIIRQHEAAQGPYDDHHIQRHLENQPNFDARVITRAKMLVERNDLASAIDRYQFSWRLTLVLLLLAAMVSGIGLAMQLTPAQARTVSLIEALIMLVMVNALFILVWCVTMMAKPRARGLAGWLFKFISGRLLSSRLHKTEIVRVATAHTSVMHRYKLIKPTFASVSHIVWTFLLTAALLTLVTRFIAFEYEFVWRTTLLSDAQIQALLNAFHTVPSLLGLPRPDIDQLSGVPNDNRAVAIWLISCVFIYALLPRLILLLGSLWLYRQRAKYLPLDWSLAGFSELQQQWQRSATVEVDPPPASIQRHGPKIVEQSTELGNTPTTVLETVRLQPQLVMTVDWSASQQSDFKKQFQTYPDVSVCSANSAAERQQLLEALHRHAQVAPRTLVLINAQLSPDRGTLRFIDTLTEYTTPQIGLVSGKSQRNEQVWRDYLGEHLAETSLVTLPSGPDDSFAEHACSITLTWLAKP